MYQLKEEKFLSIAQKEKVIKNWIAFIKSGFKRTQFTEALYHHLTLHCDFIAHYSIHGFYEEYFTTGADKIRFIEQFDRKKIGNNWWFSFKITGAYSDLNNAMIDELEKYLSVCYAAANAEQKQLDLSVAERLLAQHGLTLSDSVKPVKSQAATVGAATQINLF